MLAGQSIGQAEEVHASRTIHNQTATDINRNHLYFHPMIPFLSRYSSSIYPIPHALLSLRWLFSRPGVAILASKALILEGFPSLVLLVMAFFYFELEKVLGMNNEGA